jgi:rare lipoprotein A
MKHIRSLCWLRFLAAGTALSVLVLILAGCAVNATIPPPPPLRVYRSPPAPAHAGSEQSHIVRASWYGSEFADHRTASGERFDPNQFTAASKTLPLGSVVQVTNPKNGLSVRVRINDRGPYVRGRSLDLSRRAAQKLGITHEGVAPVKITTLRRPTSDIAVTKSRPPRTKNKSVTASAVAVPARMKRAARASFSTTNSARFSTYAEGM